MEKIIAKGAEAVLFKEGGRLIKQRIEKGYRVSELDDKLRKYRTQREAKILENAYKANIPVPRVYGVDLKEKKIIIEFIEGRLLKDVFPQSEREDILKISGEVGRIISSLHEVDIIHNDLTTSNMIWSVGRVFLIDFGLSVTSSRVEDKAMDLVVFKKALKATHANMFDLVWDSFIEGYVGYCRSAEVLRRVSAIEKRGRYL